MRLAGNLGKGKSVLAIAIVVPLAVTLFLSGCIKGGSETTWSGESRSPDGKRVASAFTVEQSGFGTGGGGTDVYLNFTTGSQRKLLILAFSDAPSAPDAMNVGMNWLSATHLELTYKGERPLDFQAARCYGVDISVRVLPNQGSSTNRNWMQTPPPPPSFADKKDEPSRPTH